MRQIVGEIVLTEPAIRSRVGELGRKITADYRGKDAVLVGILRGAALFMADLIRQIELPIEIDFMSVSSYGAATKSTGVVRIMKDLAVNVEGKEILVVEDVVDTGLTWNYLKHVLEARGPRSVRICSLLDKPEARKIDVKVDYVGFEIPNKFVIGYGLDWREKYRNLPFVCTPAQGIAEPPKS